MYCITFVLIKVFLLITCINKVLKIYYCQQSGASINVTKNSVIKMVKMAFNF